MKTFDRTIELRDVAGSRVSEVRVTRTADLLFWCKSKSAGESLPLDLGPIKLDRDSRTLWPHFDLAQLGDDTACRTFMALVGAHLIREGIA